MWTFFGVCLVLILASIVALLRRYCSKNVSLVIQLTTAYAWLVSFSIVALTPIDVWATMTSKPQRSVEYLWDVSYWSTQVLTWLVLPFFQVYADAGDFTVGGKCLTSLKENGILYGLGGLAGIVGICLMFSIKQFNFTDLMSWGIALSNAFGLSVGILLLGYGLVEIPRHMWKSEPEQMYKWAAHRAGRLAESVIKTTQELEAVVTVICANQRQMSRRDPLRPLMEKITDYAEKESPVKPSTIQQCGVDVDSLSADDLEYNYDTSGLAQLRRRLFQAISEYHGAHTQYEAAILQAFELEDIVKARQLKEYAPRSGTVNAWTQTVWYYKCLVHPYARKVCSAILVGVALSIIWTEATIFTGRHHDLSPFSLLVKKARASEFGVQALVLLPLGYICLCTYSALFQLTAFNYNKLVPKATTGPALMQNGSLACRFAAPTCWNFVHMIHMAGDVQGSQTVFSQKFTMGNLGFLSKHLNTYLPVLLVVHCFLIWLNLWDRITGSCVGSKYRFSNDDVDDEYTERGRALIRKEQELRMNGFQIGELLHSSYLDLEVPGFEALMKKTKTSKKGKGWFSFGGQKAVGAQVDPGPTSTYKERALGGRWAAGSKQRSGEEVNNSGGGTPEHPGAANKGGLDGLFAELTGPSGQTVPRSSGPPRSYGGTGEDMDERSGESMPMLAKWKLGRR